MLTRRVKVQAVIFVIIGLVAAAFIAVRYVGLFRLFGVGVYTVHLELPAAGGIFPNAEVDYRGVPVGRVGNVVLTADGVEAELILDNSAPRIPSNVQADVTDRSVIGEQYVDLQPRTDSGPYLANGSTIGKKNSGVPPTAYSLLTSTNALLKSIPIDSMRTVVNQLDTAFSGSSDNLRRLIQTSRSFITAADRNFPQTAALIQSSKTVLATQRESAASIRSFSSNLALLSGQLASHDSDVSNLISQVPSAARTAAQLIRQVGTPLGVTISNLTSTSQIAEANVRGIQELLVQLPHAVDIGNTVVSPQGANVGLTLTFFNPLPCTQGYLGTQRRSGLSTGPGAPLNTSAGCTSDGTSDVRGSQHVPSNSGSVPPWVTSYAGNGDVNTASTLGQLMGGN